MTLASSRVKILIIGDSTCGKTSLLRQFVNQRFDPAQDMTIGVDLGFRTITVGERCVKLQIWDTSGQDIFSSITRVYYRGVHVILLVYDLTNERSYHHVKKWLDHIQSVWRDDYQPIIMLVGNKMDIGCHRVISQKEAEAFAKRNELLFAETSAKSGEGVEDVFLIPVSTFLKTHPSLVMEDIGLVDLETPDPNILTLTSGSGCCW